MEPLPRLELAGLRREILRQAWPVVLQNLLHTLMFYVDTYMIGELGGAPMAAMGVVGPISHTLTSMLSALSVGTIAVVARAWGAGDRSRQESEAASSLAVGLAIGLPLTVLGWFALPAMAGLFRVRGESSVLAMAEDYLRYEAAALWLYCLYMSAAGVLRACGHTTFPMLATLGANVLNVFLNWVFIFGHLGAPPMGVAGAGLATAICLGLESVATAGYLWTSRSPVRLRPASFRLVTRESLARLVRVSVPAAVEPLVLQSGFLVYTKAITLLGTLPMAAHRAAITIESLTFMPGYGFAVAGAAVVGQCLGAARPDRADAALRECTRMATYLMSAIGLAFLLFGEPLARVFLRSPELEGAVSLAATCLAIAALEQPFMAISMGLAGGLRGAGDTKSPLIVGIVGVWGVRVPLAWALAFGAGLGLNGIWITMIVDWAVRAWVFSILHRRGRWKTLKL